MAIDVDKNRVEFLGIEIIFTAEDDPRGSVWVPFSEELTLLYGKNGAGKSTILKAIDAFVSGQTLAKDGVLIYGFARLKDGRDTCALMNQAIEDMPNTRFLNEWEDVNEAEIIRLFAETVSALDLPYNKWESSLFAAVPESVDDLDMTWEKFVTHFLFLGLWERDIRHNFPAIKSFVQHLIQERIFCFQPTGQDNEPAWQMNLAAKLDSPEIREAYELVLEMDDYVFMDQELDNDVAAILQDLNILAERATPTRTNSPYVPAARIDSRAITDIGIATIDLNEELDLEEWTQRRVIEMIHASYVSVSDPWFAPYPGHLSPTQAFNDSETNTIDTEEDYAYTDDDAQPRRTIWRANFGSREIPSGSTIDFSFESDRQTILQRALTFIAKELPRELGVTDMRIALSHDLGLWVMSKAGVLEVLDSRTHSWIPVVKTSAATQKIIGMALRIHAEIRSTSRTVVAIGDEVDPGLHTLAIQGLYGMLAASTQICFITSHSPVALATKYGNRLHVHRGVFGEILIGAITSSELSTVSATELGLKVNELIGTIDVVLAVEGLHDKLVLEHAISQDQRLNHKRLHITTISGVKNSANLLDIEFILNFTDLKILAITDNISHSELTGMRTNSIDRLNKGTPNSKVAHSLRSRSKELKSQQWFEQAQMFELLALATERGLLARLSITGHPYADIETALPHKLFGLEKPWDELEADYRQYKNQNQNLTINFKEYLRSHHNVSIDQVSIKKALSQLNEIPSGIHNLLTEILSHVEEEEWNLTNQE